MSIVAVTRILDEADIAEAFVRHTSRHVGHHILLDNGSRDGTLEILEALRREGLPVSVLSTSSVAFSEGDALTFLFHRAATEHGARWVLFLDADEFVDDRGAPDGLAALLAAWDREAAPPLQVLVALSDYVAIVHDVAAEACVPRRIQWRSERGQNLKAILSTRRGTAGIAVDAGGHGAHWEDTGAPLRPAVIDGRLTHAHFSERNTYQWMVKVVRGWAKVLASGSENERAGMAGHYRSAFAVLRDHPERVLLDETLMSFKNERPGLIHDPIDYRGGALRYGQWHDARVGAARALVGFIEDLARRHGALLDALPEARALEAEWDQAKGAAPEPR